MLGKYDVIGSGYFVDDPDTLVFITNVNPYIITGYFAKTRVPIIVKHIHRFSQIVEGFNFMQKGDDNIYRFRWHTTLYLDLNHPSLIDIEQGISMDMGLELARPTFDFALSPPVPGGSYK